MVDRRVKVTAEMDASGMVRGAKQAEEAVDRVGKSMKKAADSSDEAVTKQTSAFDRMAKSAMENERAWTTAGTAITAFGAVTVGALTASAKAAVDWESAFAGVKKTVDDSEAGYAALSDELREMARTLPAAHAEIAGVAEAAGQLGISRENLTAFTRTMIDLGETTNLSADEAATSLARFANVMGTSQDEFDNLGSAIVGLGNNFATTEAEIVDMSMRLAGAGRQAGMTEGDVLGLATALSSVGIQAEAGGTAFSKVITEMGIAVDTSNEKLVTFAEVAGMSAQEFRRAWAEDSGSAVAAFVEGMGRIQASGESLEPILDDLSMTDIRVGDALRRSAASSDLFAESMRMGNAEYEKNTALSDEAAKRYETVASQLQVFRNNVVDTALSLGEAFLPTIAAVTEAGTEMLQWIGGLPEPMRKLAAWSGAAAGGAGLLAGSFLLLAPRAFETYKAFEALGIVGPRTTTAIRNMASVLTGPWGIAIAAAVTAIGFFAVGQAEARKKAEELRESLDAQTGAITDNTRAWLTNDLQDRGIIDSYAEMGGNVRDLTLAIEGDAAARERIIRTVSAFESANKRAAASTGGLGVNLSDASTATQIFIEQLDRYGVQIDEQAAKQRLLAEAQSGVARSSESLAAESARLTAQAEAYGVQVGDTASTLTNRFIPAMEQAAAMGEEAAEDYAKWVEGMVELDASFISTSEAIKAVNEEQRGWAEGQAEEYNKSIEAHNEWVRETGEGTEKAAKSWSDFAEDAKFSLSTFIEELENQVLAQERWEANMLLLTGSLSGAALQMLEEMGPAGAQVVDELVRKGDAEMFERLNDVAAQRGGEAGNEWANAYADALSAPVFKAIFAKFGEERGGEVAEEIAKAVAAGEMTVAQAVEEYDLTAYINLEANPDAYNRDLEEGLKKAREADATVPIKGDSRPAEERLSTLEQIVEASTPSIKIDAEDDLAQGVRLGFMEDVKNSNPVVNIFADTYNAVFALRSFLGMIPRSVSIGISAVPGFGILGAIPGFMAGGYTGDGPVYEPKGIVHADEFVLKSSTISDPYNRAAAEFMHSGRSIREWSPPVSMPGNGGGGGGRNIEVNVPVQTVERADPNLIGAAVAWQVGGLP